MQASWQYSMFLSSGTTGVRLTGLVCLLCVRILHLFRKPSRYLQDAFTHKLCGSRVNLAVHTSDLAVHDLPRQYTTEPGSVRVTPAATLHRFPLQYTMKMAVRS